LKGGCLKTDIGMIHRLSIKLCVPSVIWEHYWISEYAPSACANVR